MKHHRITIVISLIVLLSALVITTGVPRLVSGSTEPTLNNLNSVMNQAIVLNQTGTVRIHIDEANITNISVAVRDQANFDLMQQNLPYSNISALTVTDVPSVDEIANLPAGTYYIQISSNVNLSLPIDGGIEAFRNAVTVTYPSSQPSQLVIWAIYGLTAVSVAGLAYCVYTLVRKPIVK